MKTAIIILIKIIWAPLMLVDFLIVFVLAHVPTFTEWLTDGKKKADPFDIRYYEEHKQKLKRWFTTLEI